MGWTNPSANSSQPTGPPSARHFQDPLGIGAANDERRGPDWDAQRWQDFLAGDLGEMSKWPPENNWGVLWLVGVYSCGLGWKRYFSMFMFQYVVLYSTVDVFSYALLWNMPAASVFCFAWTWADKPNLMLFWWMERRQSSEETRSTCHGETFQFYTPVN